MAVARLAGAEQRVGLFVHLLLRTSPHSRHKGGLFVRADLPDESEHDGEKQLQDGVWLEEDEGVDRAERRYVGNLRRLLTCEQNPSFAIWAGRRVLTSRLGIISVWWSIDGRSDTTTNLP